MGRDDAPAFGEAYPGLHLAAEFAGHARAMIERRRDGVIAAVGADDGLRQGARQACRRARSAECRDLGVTIKILAAAIADGARIVAKNRIQRGDVVRHQGLLVAREFGRNFGNDLRQVDLHGRLLCWAVLMVWTTDDRRQKIGTSTSSVLCRPSSVV